MRWTAEQVAGFVGGVLVGDSAAMISAVSTDSRTTARGDLFVAIRGEIHDGHAYVDAAMAAGAAVAMVDHPTDAEPRIEVADTTKALLGLAVAARQEMSMPVVAITGSTGKTSTKDLAVAALPDAYGSPRSFNNEIGVPLTVLATPDGIGHLVMEVGSRGRGHIAELMPAVLPDVAVITNLGVVHMETFGTPEGLAAAKWELVEALGDDGTAVLPADEPRLLPPVRKHLGRTLTFGMDEADVTVRDLELSVSGCPRFFLDTPDGSAEVQLPLIGAHQALNAAAVVAAGVAVNVPLAVMMAGLEHATPSQWRMERHDGRYTVINDAYNANPDSMTAAFGVLDAMPGRHIAVLGRMAELGHLSEPEHRRIGKLASDMGFDAVVVVGDDPGLASGAGAIAQSVATVDDAASIVSELVEEGDVVLVKASRAVGLERLAEQLIEEARA